MSNIKKLLGQRIKELRKSKKITQEKLAEKIGIGTSNISYIENGNQPLSEHTYGKSITDPCLGWEKSERLLMDMAEQL